VSATIGGDAGSALGVIVAGGGSTRFGSPKGLATVGGVPLLERVRRALSAVTAEVVLVANDPAPYADFGLPTRPDRRSGAGALGGLHTAASWAAEAGHAGALCVACDMPFVTAGLLRRLVERAGAGDAVVPESRGPRGVEPLCAWYGTAVLPAMEAALDRGDHRVIGFYDDVRIVRLPLAEVRTWGEPEVLFMNVNTPSELAAAEALWRNAPRDGGAAGG
jgi:molybdopterin-guanine dinucleotide biosynthesis protein A